MSLIEVVDFFGFLFILIAAFTITSKYVVKPKVRIFAFSCYLIACFFLATLGMLNGLGWFIAQQIILMGINVRGMYYAVKDLKLLNAVKELKFGEPSRH